MPRYVYINPGAADLSGLRTHLNSVNVCVIERSQIVVVTFATPMITVTWFGVKELFSLPASTVLPCNN